jgi:isoaspartyl peptidase/L-asparaginase-like protein (Ntn-hydrolase superfamily)
MDGRTLSCGGVAGVENVRHVADLARRVMERTPHVLLVGEGARLFAVKEGFPLETLLTAESVAEWEKTRPKQKKDTDKKPDNNKDKGGGGGGGGNSRDLAPKGSFPSDPREDDNPDSHDTVTVLGMDKKGNLGGVCTTSGLAHKLPGRVGDSPIIGAGLYVDDEAGAAGGTGVGEEIVRIGAGLLIVEAMRAGRTPQEACEAAVRRVNNVSVRRGVHVARVAFIALDPKGRVGAAATTGTSFRYAVGRRGKSELLEAREIPVR